MEHIISALVPIFSLILIGYGLNKINFPSSNFWPMADKLTYYILMPSLLIYKLSNSNISDDNSFLFIFSGIFGILIIFGFILFINYLLKFENRSFTSIVQGVTRFNTYVFLALADSIYANEGLLLAVLLITFLIPVINLICITTFSLFVNTNNNFCIKSLYKNIITNPLIIACFIGGTINYFDISIPTSINNTLKILSGAALPLGLISVGVSLVIKDITNTKKELLVSVIGKLILMPFILGLIGYIIGLNTLMIMILVLFGSMPTAPSSFVLARQLGGDIQLISSIISIQTLISIFSIAFILNLINTLI